MKSRFVLLAALALGACTSDERDIDAELAREAERVRELMFVTTPRVEHTTRASYLAEAAERGKATPEAKIAELRAVQGRLGFIPKSYEVRKAEGEVAELFGAWYSPERKAITLIERPSDSLYVHELVHALQDQHFDLKAFDARAKSTDAFLARRAVTEGDATLAQVRYGTGGSFRRMQEALDLPETKRRVDEVLSSQTPAYFLAYPSFVYTYGATFAARIAGIYEGQFARERLDALFGDAVPKSSEEVVRRAEHEEVDPIEPVGLTAMPKELANDFDVVDVDCLGAWYTYLLLRDDYKLLPSRPTDSTAPNLLSARDLVKLWDGDQLVVIGERDRSITPKRKPPLAIVWTSIWENEISATSFLTLLQKLQDTIADGEEMILEQDGKQVVFVKGAIDAAKMRTLADAALRRPPVEPPLVPRLASPHFILP